MAIRNRIFVVLIDGATNLVLRQKDWGESEGGSSSVETETASGQQVVAVFVEKDADGEAGGPFWDEYSGNSMYSVQETPEGISMGLHDITPTKTRIRETLNDGSLRAIRLVDPKLAEATMGKGSNWDVFEDGQGSLYEQKLAEARTLVGVPS
jgi:hypothetical protein